MLELIFNTFVALLVVVDPMGLAPVFAGLTQGYSEQEKREIAKRATLIGGMVLLGFALIGHGLLNALGIGIGAFRIAGGALLFLTALDMIFARPSGVRSKTVEGAKRKVEEHDIAVFPLATPLIAGPGAITTILLYAGDKGPIETATVLAVLGVVLLLVYISLYFTTRIVGFFGETGANVMARVFGVLLAALAAQLIIDGILVTLA